MSLNTDATFFADYIMETGNTFLAPVRSLIDMDFYKFTTGQVIHMYNPHEIVTFELIIRDKTIPVAEILNETELRNSLDFVRDLRLRHTDIYLMRGIDLYEHNMFKEPYLDFLKTLSLPPYSLTIEGKAIKLRFSGTWPEVTGWETVALAIISELYYRAILRKMSHADVKQVYWMAMRKLERKLETIRRHPGIKIADFSHRRRHSFLWQKWMLGKCKETLGDQFTGTSNTYLAFAEDLVPIGTFPHEPTMVKTALAKSIDAKLYAQYEFLECWRETYGEGLRIFLPDTYGSEQFFAQAPEFLLKWRGQRQDSGDPVEEGERYIRWLEKGGEDPKDHVTIFSDGLDVDAMVRIDKHFGTQHSHPYGWGTLLGNDFRGCSANPLLRPFSMVCKVVSVNGHETVKLSNNIEKATGSKEAVAEYAKIFGNAGRSRSSVLV